MSRRTVSGSQAMTKSSIYATRTETIREHEGCGGNESFEEEAGDENFFGTKLKSQNSGGGNWP